MTIHDLSQHIASGTGRRQSERVLAFHCSGGSPNHYHMLEKLLDKSLELDSPEYFGTGYKSPWHGEYKFSLADDAEESIRKMDENRCKSYHLVGHSYGGAVALHVALARPELVKSLTRYEPCVFNLLKFAGMRGHEALNQITLIADHIADAIRKGNCRAAMETFIDYWNGDGTWAGLCRSQQKQIMRWAPKTTLEFSALLNEETSLVSVDALKVPSKIIYGESTPFPTLISSIFLATMLVLVPV